LLEKEGGLRSVRNRVSLCQEGILPSTGVVDAVGAREQDDDRCAARRNHGEELRFEAKHVEPLPLGRQPDGVGEL